MTDLHFIASPQEDALREKARLIALHGQADFPANTKTVVTIGGDGTILRALQLALPYDIPVFGINFGHEGFLANPAKKDDLVQRIAIAEERKMAALEVTARGRDGSVQTRHAINDAYFVNACRSSAIRLQVKINGRTYFSRLDGDGLICATAIGSTGYSRAAGGPIVSLAGDVIIVTPNNACYPFTRPRAAVMEDCIITVKSMDPKRQVDLYVDDQGIASDVAAAQLRIAPSKQYRILFDRGYDDRRRLFQAQGFSPS